LYTEKEMTGLGLEQDDELYSVNSLFWFF